MDNEKKEKKIRPDPPEGSCHFYVERKNRYCRFHPAKDAKYCAEHATAFGVDLGRERVHCPYEPKHTCYADKLKHHMKKCPSRPKAMPAYYSVGINSGDNDGEVVPEPKLTVLTVTIEELERIIDRVTQLYSEHVGELESDVLSHPCMKKELENPSYGTAAIRHRKQQASLIGHMEKLGLLSDDRCFLEMGAGKGQLSHWLHGAVESKKNIGFVLIDRSHVRNKMDNLHKEEMIMERIRIDIENLRLDKVPSIESTDRSVVAFGKHLCGPATDLALRCVTETLNCSSTDHKEDGQMKRKRLKSQSKSLSGAVIALCCHHRCEWKPYVGKSFFKSCGLTARDFQIISSMSSWATCAWKGWSFQRKVEAKLLEDKESDKMEAKQSENEHLNNTEAKELENKESDKMEIKQSEKEHLDNTEAKQLENKESDKMKAKQSENKLSESSEATEISGEKTDKTADTLDEAVPESYQDSDRTEYRTKAGGSKAGGRGDDNGKDDVVDDGDDLDEHTVDNITTTSSINSKLSQEEREIIGRKCKRLIDYGRVKYLCDHGMDSGMKVYIEEFYTPENVVLTASS